MYKNLIRELEGRGLSLFYVSKIIGIPYNHLIDKLNGRMEFTNSEITKIFDLISDKGTDDYFDYLFSVPGIHN